MEPFSYLGFGVTFESIKDPPIARVWLKHTRQLGNCPIWNLNTSKKPDTSGIKNNSPANLTDIKRLLPIWCFRHTTKYKLTPILTSSQKVWGSFDTDPRVLYGPRQLSIYFRPFIRGPCRSTYKLEFVGKKSPYKLEINCFPIKPCPTINWSFIELYPIAPMYGTVTYYINHKDQPNVGKYTRHGLYGYCEIKTAHLCRSPYWKENPLPSYHLRHSWILRQLKVILLLSYAWRGRKHYIRVEPTDLGELSIVFQHYWKHAEKIDDYTNIYIYVKTKQCIMSCV